eukprot:CAMPEP_0197029466 /NCGR_PEP_ID=MMETSP1384-20130603/8903_1 /TAXON_ID=29189 /ORGANISM="Ammonia sp." /LENGTH=282 /DNA_ID=CAMNT_0042458633 /DNA_START=12 /DNA_END=860 /DNA_ORIENTATION=+
MAQPGDEKQDEGQGDQYENYRCVFRESGDSLYAMLKDTKSKRTFTNTFSKSTLIEMGLNQPLSKVINLLTEAKSGTKPGLSFKVAFGDAKNEKPVTLDKLSTSYEQGHALYVFVTMDYSFFYAEHQFKLLEQQRKEADILRDMIADMQDEIDELKKAKRTGIVSWYTTKTGGGNIPMSGAHLEPTLEGMVTLSQDLMTITIGMAGLYRVSMEPNFTSATGAGHYIQIQLNGSVVVTKWGSNGGGFGLVSRVLNLKKDDKIVFYANHLYASSKDSSCFIIEKL